MPISSYALLKTIAEGKSNNILGYSDAIKAIKDFNLYAFIIHDPEKHNEFDKYLIGRFDELDLSTSNKLLFFALVDPPKEWSEHAYSRQYYRELQTRELVAPYNSILSKSPSVTALSIANTLKIPYESLPCIVVFSNFKMKEFAWYSTSEKHVERQLNKLGYLASRKIDGSINKYKNFNYGYEVLDILKQYNNELDLCNGQGDEILDDSLASKLADVLSGVVANSNDDMNVRSFAESHLGVYLSNLEKQIMKIKEGNIYGLREDDITRLEQICINIITSMFNHRNNKIDFNELVINKGYLEDESYIILKTAHAVFNDLKSKCVSREEEFDFTASSICFSKVFEKEINLSQVHWIRKKLGVDLPEYYNSYQPKQIARLIPKIDNPREIDFNRASKGRWLPPGIGESRLCWEDLINIDIPDGWNKKQLDDLNEKWKGIIKIRNMSAHAELVDVKLVEELIGHLKYMEERQYFKLLSKMKQSFSNV